MNNNLTAIAIVLDGSGSMFSTATDTRGSFNQFLKEQKDQPGEALFTLVQFNERHEVINDFVKLASVGDLTDKTYAPHGSTALLDAMGFTINLMGEKLSAMSEVERPSKVMMVVITDGQENMSKVFNKDQIRSMLKHQQEKYSWEILFFGSSLNEITDAQSLGVARQNTRQYSPTAKGVQRLYSNISSNVSNYRAR